MNSILKNLLAVVIGFLAGSVVNMGLIMISNYVIPPPLGTDNSTMEGLSAAMNFYEPKHFIFPFLAHALGTFVGAFFTAMIAANNQIKLAFVIAFLFLIGGITMVMSLPSPLWFNLLDLIVAYIPMAYLGAKFALAGKKSVT